MQDTVLTQVFSAEDVAYIEEHFACLPVRPEREPAPAYVLPDGRAFYPRDHADQETDEKRFKSRLRSAAVKEQIEPLDAEETWQTYMEGIYGVCLRRATPENIVRKAALLARIEALTVLPDEANPQWITDLKNAVDALDELERPFSPHFDRVRFGRPPTRDSHIHDVRRRFPQIV